MRWPYFALMGTCITLFALSGLVIRLFSPTLAIVCAAVAVFIPPIAAIVANAGRENGDPRADPDRPDDPQDPQR